METKLDIDKIENRDVEYIQQLLYDYYMKYLNKKKEGETLGYYYISIHNVDFNDKEIYWYLSEMNIITIECYNQEQAILLDLMLEILFMKKESYFKYYLDWYFDSMTEDEYKNFSNTGFSVKKFIQYLIKSHIDNNLISKKYKNLRAIDTKFPPTLEEHDKYGNMVKSLTFPTTDVFIYTPEVVLNLMKSRKIKENKIDRVKQLLGI